MKQKLLHILLLLTLSICASNYAWGQYYVLNEANEYSLNTIEIGPTFSLSGPGTVLTFEAAKSKGFFGGDNAVGNFYVQVSKDGSNWSDLSEKLGLSLDFKTYTYTIAQDVKYIRFVTKTGATYTKYYRYVRVTRATTFSSSPSSIAMGEVLMGNSKSDTITFDYNNTYDQTLTASCDNSAFVLSKSSWSLGATGSGNFSVSFAANTLGDHNGNITLTRGSSVVATIPVSATVTGRYNTTFNYSLGTVSPNCIYKLVDYFTTNNPNAYSFVVNEDESRAKIIDGNLYVYAGTGTISITIAQEGSDTWNAHSETYTMNVGEAQIETSTSVIGDFDIYDGVVWEVYNKQLAFPFPCDKVTYDVELQSAAVNYFSIKVSKDHGASWEVLENPNRDITTDRKSFTEVVAPTTTHIDLIRDSGSSLGLYFYNFTFHMASYMTPQQTSVSFDRTKVGETSAVKTVVVDWSNVEDARNNLMVMCDDPNFQVSVMNNPCTPANQTWGTSNEMWGQSVISITYTPQSEGTHPAKIYFNDNKRFITISVSGEAYNELTLDPLVDPTSQIPPAEPFYASVTLNRVLPQGHCTVTFPFDFNVGGIAGAYVAQLELVTYNEFDGYTLFFKKEDDGQMSANQPYLVYLPVEFVNPGFGLVALSYPVANSISNERTQGWTMHANYTPGLSMAGKYGIAGGKLRKGAEGSTINAYTAYFEPPTDVRATVRVAMVDERGDVTYIEQLPALPQNESQAIYSIDGKRLQQLQRGINIVKMEDGSVRKILK